MVGLLGQEIIEALPQADNSHHLRNHSRFQTCMASSLGHPYLIATDEGGKASQALFA